MADFWNTIVQSNTFNFAILVIILAVIFAKINLPEIIEKIRSEISGAIENAQTEKETADKKLKNAKKVLKNLDNEIKEKIDGAKLNAKTQSDKIIQDSDLQVKRIETGIKKTINAIEKKISTQLTEETAKKSLELAKKHILAQLDDNLHQKFIDESIEELDKIW